MNILNITGNLTADPEVRTVQTSNGDTLVANFTVAVNRRYRETESTDYFRVSVWGKAAENAKKYLAKGRKVGVCGAVSCRAYTAQDGSARAQMEISRVEHLEYLTPAGKTQSGTNEAKGNEFTEVYDDELPF